MGYQVSSATIASGATGLLSVPNSGAYGYVISNRSGYELAVTLEGSGISKILFPGTADFYPYRYGFSGIISYTVNKTLPNVLNYPGTLLSVELISKAEQFDSSKYPMSISAVQAVSPTASGKNLFTLSVGFGSTSTVEQNVNVFNPSTSKTTLTFHSARVYTNDASGPTANLYYTSGADLNLANVVTPASHAGSKTPPTSVTRCTWSDSTAPNPTTDIEVMNMQQNVTQDFLLFPDNVSLEPGGNITVVLVSSTMLHVVRISMKWSEGT